MSTWEGNWELTLRSRIEACGFSNAYDFVMSEPGTAFGEFFRRLRDQSHTPPIAMVQFQTLYFRDADTKGTLQIAVASTLYRRVSRAFPKGWGIGTNVESRRLSVFADWELPNQFHGFEIFALDVATWFENAEIDSNWIPLDHTDPILHAAIEFAWQKTAR